MGGIARFSNGGASCKAVHLSHGTLVTAGGTGDNTEIDSGWIDVRGYRSAKLVILAKSSIAANKALNIIAALKDATDSSGTSSATYGTGVTGSQMDAGGAGGVTNHLSQMELDYDLSGARGYIQANVTPDMTASGTDTSNVSFLLLLFGAGEEPITAKAN
jgi:hypothetical protein